MIYLQRLGADGNWHSEEIRSVTHADTFQFRVDVRQVEARTSFRARITGDRGNVGGASTPVTIQVSPATSTATLPPAS